MKKISINIIIQIGAIFLVTKNIIINILHNDKLALILYPKILLLLLVL